MLAKVLLVIFLLFKLVSFLSKKEVQKIEIPPNENNWDTVTTKTKIQEDSSPIEHVVPKNNTKTKPDKNSFIHLQETIRYKGKPVPNAYFTISGCSECKSTLSGKDGSTKIKIPAEAYNDGRTHDFYVYASDTLLYHKAMRFINFQLNKY